MRLLVYETPSRRRPFVKWFEQLDKQNKAAIRRRLRAVEEYSHLGDCASLRGGLYEMRFAGRIGLRVYFTIMDRAIVLLLGGSRKDHQKQAIRKARKRLNDFQERNGEQEN